MGLLDGKTGTPKANLLSDLKVFIADLQLQSNEILICGDFNEPFANGSNSFELATTLGLVDLLDSHIGTTHFSTHQRNQSNVRIDYALASPTLSQSIAHSGYFPFGLYYKVDHRGFYIDFNLKALLGEAVPDILTPKRRTLNSKHKKNRARYVKEKYEELVFHNFFDRLTELCTSSEFNHVIAEQLSRYWL